MNLDLEMEELYKRYTMVYEIEYRECSSIFSVNSLKILHMLEDLTFEEFKEKMSDDKFKNKWGVM